MKQVRIWTRRVSLAIFAVSAIYVVTHLNDYPEVSHIESKTEAFAVLMFKVLR
ncbi:MAG: hypothetical protein HWE13_11280 [Gammaproteobacteria bacterium]|nr:hypothetical protein [Gammaproteobacteria bacterium]NVK88703.1 hypothetical protein [Gammaproteobacteria bacterium]